MSYIVTYYCPRCGTLAGLEREGYLDDKSVTPYPLEGWSYVDPEASFDDADGVRFVCGEGAAVSWETPPTGDEAVTEGDTGPEDDADDTGVAENPDLGCGEPFYLSFVRFENGEEVDPRAPGEQVELAEGSGPTGPGGPDGPTGPDGGGFWG